MLAINIAFKGGFYYYGDERPHDPGSNSEGPIRPYAVESVRDVAAEHAADHNAARQSYIPPAG